jgi:hypothetical protein
MEKHHDLKLSAIVLIFRESGVIMIGVEYKFSGISSLRKRGVDFAHLAVYPSSDTLERLELHERYKLTDRESPVSVDIPVDVFYRLNGSKVTIPFEIQPREIIFAESPVKPVLNEGEFMSLETKSNVSRTGLSVLGFCKQGKYATILNSSDRVMMMVYMKNDASVPYVIDEVPYPFQVVIATPCSDPGSLVKGGIKILTPKKEDITEGVRTKVGGMEGYVFTLSPEMWGMENVPGKKIRWSERKYDAQRLFRKGLIDEMDLGRFPFSLTLSNELIEAGCPAYVFPFRFGSNPMNYVSRLYGKEKKLRYYILKPARNTKVTGNSGIIHKGSKNKTVFENSTRDLEHNITPKKLREFFEVGTDFGFVVPLAMTSQNFKNDSYNGGFNEQEKICV